MAAFWLLPCILVHESADSLLLVTGHRLVCCASIVDEVINSTLASDLCHFLNCCLHTVLVWASTAAHLARIEAVHRLPGSSLFES